MANLDIIRGRQTVAPLTNKSGGSVVAGDLVVVDTTTDESFTTTSTTAAEVSIGVAQESIANNAIGRILLYGYAPTVTTAGVSVTRGHYLFHSSNTKTGRGAASRASGATGQFLKSSTTPSAWLWGAGDQTATASAPTFVGCKAYSAATQSISDATSTAVALELEEYDTDAFHSLVTNNSRFTVPAGKAGKYLLTGGVSFAAGASPVLAQVWWILNGTTDIRGSGQSWLPSTTQVFQFTSTAQVLLAVGDYVELFCYQDSSGSRNIGHATTVFLQSNGAVALMGA